MEGGEKKMAGQGSIDGDLGGFEVADLSDENDIGVLADDTF